MATLLIVDDEKETREGLMACLEWKELGICEVKAIGSGHGAIRLCASYMPDVMISDIRMPDMDGIELCIKLRNFLPACQIIFISAYTDKEYFKAAIKLQAVSYVEKPIDPEELREAVQKAMNRRQMACIQEPAPLKAVNPSVLQELILLNLITGHLTGSCQNAFARAGLFQSGEAYFRVLLFKGKNGCQEEDWQIRLEQIVSRIFLNFSPLVVKRDDLQMIVVLGLAERAGLDDDSQKWDELFCAIQNELRHIPVFCAVGSCEAGMEAIIYSYQNAVIIQQELFFCGYNRIRQYQKAEAGMVKNDLGKQMEQVRKITAAFKAAVAKWDMPKAKQALFALYRICGHMPPTHIPYIKNEYISLRRALYQEAGREEHHLEENHWEDIYQKATLKEIHELMIQLVEEEFQLTERSAMIRNVLQLLEAKFADEELSIKELADAVYVTPSYLSRMFKQEMGKTIGQYLTDVRIDHAKTLLLDNKLKLYHISMLVGYGNPSYFTKLFKKKTGLMPSEYRDRKRL